MILKNKKFLLNNGLRVLFLEQKEARASALGIAINAGPYFEDEDKLGSSHLLEHLIGRSKRDGLTLREKAYENNGILDAVTSVSQTFYHLYTFPENLLENSKILVDGVYFPEFETKDLETSKESVVSEMAFAQDLSSYEVLRKMMWKESRLTRSIIGAKDSILGIDLAKIKDFHQKFYSAGNSSLVLIGESFSEDLLKVLEKIPVNNQQKFPKLDISCKKPDFRIFEERNLHSGVAFSFPTKGFRGLGENRHLFNIAATVLNDIYIAELGREGLVYEASWNWNVFPESGDFVVLLESLDHDHVLPSLEKGIKLINTWPNLPLEKDKFDLIKTHIILNLKIGASLVDALTLFTRNFSSSEEAHTYEEAIRVYEAANLDETLKIVNEVLLVKKPYTVVSMGADSMENLGKINQFLEEYYNGEKLRNRI